uniref:transmembrane protein 198-B-like n=1 Tax=Styela clava TaxID=7725 RepID=UPI00193977B6|nr:transmembrane protein 198-B-like [Styela clava]
MATVNDSFPGNNPGPLDCNMTLNLDYDTGLAALCVTLGLFGLLYTFVGYRCFKAVMFLSGLIFGGTVVFVLCQEERILQHTLSFGAIVGISVGIGVLCGFITMLVRYAGLFLQGFFLGLLVAIGAIIALQKFYHPSTPWIPVGILFGTGIIFALLTLKWQKQFILLSTAVMGAALICVCLEYFMEKFLLLRYIWEALMASSSTDVCWYSWVILGIWPILALLGAVIQWKFTGKGYDHTDVIILRGQRKRVRTHLVRQRRRNHSPTDTLTSVASEPPRSRPNSARAVSRDRDPQQQVSRHSSQQERGRARGAQRQQAAGAATNFDTLPPSYDDVQRGAGKPVSENEQSRIVRTKHGSFIAPAGQRRANIPNTTNTNENVGNRPANPLRDQIIRNAEAGVGYTDSSDPGPSNPPRNSERGRNNTPRSSSAGRNQERPRQQNNQSPNRSRQNSSRGRGGAQRSSSRGSRSSPAQSRSRRGNGARGGSSRGRSSNSGSLDDRQSLLTSETTPNAGAVSSRGRRPRANEAMAAHARRVQAAQERRRQNT